MEMVDKVGKSIHDSPRFEEWESGENDLFAILCLPSDFGSTPPGT